MSNDGVTDQVKPYSTSLYTRIKATILTGPRCIQMTVLIVGGNTTSSLCFIPIVLQVADSCLGIRYSQPYSTSSMLYVWAPLRWLYKWALIELAKNQPIQTKLREDLAFQYRNEGDPTYDWFTSSLPHSDAVTHEVLRMHSAICETIRVVSNSFLVICNISVMLMPH
jgi:hypothetical protein